MPEYRHIANLQGPPGSVALEGGLMPAGVDLDDFIDNGHYALSSSSTYINEPERMQKTNSASFLVFSAGHFSGVAHIIMEGRTFFFRERVSGDTWGAWTELSYPGKSPSEQIRELAIRDGWASMYDPTDERSVFTDGDGLVTAIRDSLGNDSTLRPSASTSAPVVISGEFGSLDGLDLGQGEKFLRNQLSDDGTPATIIVLGRWTGRPATGDDAPYQVLLDGWNNPPQRSNIAVRTTRKGTPFGSISATSYEVPGDRTPHIFCSIGREDYQEVLVDGQTTSTNQGSNFGLGSIVLGRRSDSGSSQFGWHGSAGLVLIYRGEPDYAKIDRMHNLLYALTGKSKRPHALHDTTTAISVTETGRVTFTHGNIDQQRPVGIQSITKLMTWRVAADYLTSSELDSVELSFEEGDEASSTRYRPGDTATIRDWAWMAMGPSYNSPNEIISRYVGQKIIDQESLDSTNPKSVFREKIADKSIEWFGDSLFVNFSYGAILSARQTVQLLQMAMEVDWLRDLMLTPERTSVITGPDAREEHRFHTIHNNCPFDFFGREYRGGKTGTGYGEGHIVTAWENPFDGEMHYTCVLDTPSNLPTARYRELKKIMTATSLSGANIPLTPSTRGLISSAERQTGRLDITESLGGVPQAGGGGVYISRMGDDVTLSFQQVALPAGDQGQIHFDFSPINTEYKVLTEDSGTARTLIINANGNMNISGYEGGELRGTVSFKCKRPWPTLPYQV